MLAMTDRNTETGGQAPRTACARNEVDGYQQTGENRAYSWHICWGISVISAISAVF